LFMPVPPIMAFVTEATLLLHIKPFININSLPLRMSSRLPDFFGWGGGVGQTVNGVKVYQKWPERQNWVLFIRPQFSNERFETMIFAHSRR
jgi:hypothetical protein